MSKGSKGHTLIILAKCDTSFCKQSVLGKVLWDTVTSHPEINPIKTRACVLCIVNVSDHASELQD